VERVPQPERVGGDADAEPEGAVRYDEQQQDAEADDVQPHGDAGHPADTTPLGRAEGLLDAQVPRLRAHGAGVGRHKLSSRRLLRAYRYCEGVATSRAHHRRRTSAAAAAGGTRRSSRWARLSRCSLAQSSITAPWISASLPPAAARPTRMARSRRAAAAGGPAGGGAAPPAT